MRDSEWFAIEWACNAVLRGLDDLARLTQSREVLDLYLTAHAEHMQGGPGRAGVLRFSAPGVCLLIDFPRRKYLVTCD